MPRSGSKRSPAASTSTQARDALGMLRGERETDPAAHRMADEPDARKAECVEQFAETGDLPRDRVVARRDRRGGAESRQIRGDDAILPPRRRQLRMPVDRGLGAEPVDEHQRLAAAAEPAPHVEARQVQAHGTQALGVEARVDQAIEDPRRPPIRVGAESEGARPEQQPSTARS